MPALIARPTLALFEQARAFGRIGADVNLTPNAVHALDGLGLGDRLRETAARPEFRISRNGDTGEETSRLPMSTAAEARYGAPQLTIHRADLLAALQGSLADGTVQLDRQVTGVEQIGDKVSMEISDGSRVEADVLIGADGIHSAVRHALFGEDHPRFTGLVSYRATFPRARGATSPISIPSPNGGGPLPICRS